MSAGFENKSKPDKTRRHTPISGDFAQASEAYFCARTTMHVTGDAAVTGRCNTPDSTVCGRYNDLWLRSAIGYVTPKDMLAGRHFAILAERDRRLEAARLQRQNRRRQAA